MWISLVLSGIAIGVIGLIVVWSAGRLGGEKKEVLGYLGTVAATFSGVVLAAGITAYQSEAANKQTMLAVFKAAEVEAGIKSGQIEIELGRTNSEHDDIGEEFRRRIASLAIDVGTLTTSSEVALNSISEEVRGSLIISVGSVQSAHVRVIDESVHRGDLKGALTVYKAELDHFRNLLSAEIERQEHGLSSQEVYARLNRSHVERRAIIFPQTTTIKLP